MAWDLLKAKLKARQALHARLAVSAVYTDEANPAPGVGLAVRWHTKLARAGNLQGGFDAEIIEGIERLVFQQSELTSKGITLARGGLVEIAFPENLGTVVFELDVEGEPDGPENVYWTVTRQL